MKGLIGASARLLVLAGLMAAVLVLAVSVGLAPTTAIALGIVAVAVVGFVAVARPRSGKTSPADEIAATMAPNAAAPAPAARPSIGTNLDAMAPADVREIDPEANMPRWRRPSLLEARRSDPTRLAPTYRIPMRFTDDQIYQLDVRTVRYAVVPLLDRPDEVLGLRIDDLASGDEVQVLSAQGTFLEVHCPNGERGWVHRTTLAQRQPAAPERHPPPEAQDDALGALLAARGLNQA